MRGIVVCKSRWGSCRKIAEAISRGLKDSGHDVRVVPVEEAGAPDPSLDFVVIGAATRWPGAWPKIRRYAGKTADAGLHGKPFATFSTGSAASGEKANRQASETLHELLSGKGMVPLAPPLKTAIEGYRPPAIVRGTLPESEVARAEEFGRGPGATLSGK